MTTITLPADQIGDGILTVEAVRYQNTRNIHPAWRGKIEPPGWVLDLLEPCDTCKGTGLTAPPVESWKAQQPCPDCHEGRRPFTLLTPCTEPGCPHVGPCNRGNDGVGYLTVGVFVVTDVQPRDDGRYNILITEVPS